MGEATVVDVRGGHGPVSTGLAKTFQDLNFIVQDLTDVVESVPVNLPADIERQLTFKMYNFLDVQPIKGA